MTVKVRHPHVASKEGICGGRPVIAGTRFTVRSIVNYVLREGVTPEELVREFTHLSLAKVYDALSFYYDHKAEIDRDIEGTSEVSLKQNTSL